MGLISRVSSRTYRTFFVCPKFFLQINQIKQKPISIKKMTDYETASNASEKEEITIASDAVVNKYKVAAEIANDALKAVLAEVKVDANSYDLCSIGDKIVAERTAA